MPIINKSSYRPPLWLPGGHAQSVYPTLFRRVPEPAGREERRIVTPDGDFLDLDFYRAARRGKGGGGAGENGALLILSHGMEGNARRKYIYGMANAFLAAGLDVMAWNFRSCGANINLRPRLYHCGDTADISAVIHYALSLGYRRVLLCGFSMGGAITMNYLGCAADNAPPEVRGAITFSVPCDLTACSRRLDSGLQRLYTANFLLTLRGKVRKKHRQYPDLYPLAELEKIKTLKEFDERYTAPVHGFASAEDYWSKSSCLQVLGNIRRPALMVNALNDPFLAGGCFPLHEAENNGNLYLEMPTGGGHVGFMPARAQAGGFYWSELRALEFAREHLLCE